MNPSETHGWSTTLRALTRSEEMVENGSIVLYDERKKIALSHWRAAETPGVLILIAGTPPDCRNRVFYATVGRGKRERQV